MQHDVQEFNRILQDKLESKMKGTPVDGMIQKLFMGKMKNYIKCVNVDFESSMMEDFYGKQNCVSRADKAKLTPGDVHLQTFSLLSRG